ncbi:recQ-mediated genome instability protein 1-like [Agrilus planipennis]|uniref:RecQ-mediated genome instability protein 1 n=1 Tax=Agrilus planipennis TaxID=224129 RepID=A0A1W4XDB9_AGRPL|nr:recQ-mediated genome instability protein 1-like [Agrilus planipennis]
MDNEVTNVKNFFSSNGLHLSDEWLESCLEWCHEQHQDVTFKIEDLHKQVYEQWLLLDLRDVKVPVLPPNLAQQIKTTLPETYYLQMMYVIDISKPKYSQLQKIRNKSAFRISDIEKEENNSNRVLQLTLTDGVQEIQAIELRPISSLHLNLTPGVKLQIVGPVIVRRGQILLEEKNIVVLDGEVEELEIQNAAENVMARALRLPENPNPIEIKDNIENISVSTQNLSTYSGVEDKSNQLQTNRVNNVTINTNAVQNRQNSLNNVNLNKNVQRLQQSKTCSNSSNNYSLTNEEEQQLAEEVEMLLNAENAIEDETQNFSEFTSRNINSSVGNTKETNEKFNQSKKTGFEFEDDDDDLFENMDIDAHLDFIDSQQLQLKQQMPIKKITSINELQFKKNNASKFTIKAKFKSVLEKLTITEGKWLLKLSVSDDTGDLAIWVHNDFMTKLGGLSAVEMENLVKSNTGENTNKINRVLADLKEKISTLNGDMIIEYEENEAVPFLTDSS